MYSLEVEWNRFEHRSLLGSLTIHLAEYLSIFRKNLHKAILLRKMQIMLNSYSLPSSLRRLRSLSTGVGNLFLLEVLWPVDRTSAISV